MEDAQRLWIKFISQLLIVQLQNFDRSYYRRKVSQRLVKFNNPTIRFFYEKQKTLEIQGFHRAA